MKERGKVVLEMILVFLWKIRDEDYSQFSLTTVKFPKRRSSLNRKREGFSSALFSSLGFSRRVSLELVEEDFFLSMGKYSWISKGRKDDGMKQLRLGTSIHRNFILGCKDDSGKRKYYL